MESGEDINESRTIVEESFGEVPELIEKANEVASADALASIMGMGMG